MSFQNTLSPIAAVHRIREAGLLEKRIDQLVEPVCERQARIRDLVRQRGPGGMRPPPPAKAASNVLPNCRVCKRALGGRHAGLEELLGCQRQLVAVLRLALPPRALRDRGVRLLPKSPASWRSMIDGEAAVDAIRSELIGRTHHVDQRFDECSLFRAEGLVAHERRFLQER